MNKKLTKVIGLIMAGAMTVMAGCGNSAPAAQGSADNAAPAQEAEKVYHGAALYLWR